jgi:hypothetical protein
VIEKSILVLGATLCTHIAARYLEATKCRVGFLGVVGTGMCGWIDRPDLEAICIELKTV